MKTSETIPSPVKSADRVLKVFELLGAWGREMSHTELVEALDIPKSSLTQLLRNLVGRGWLAYSPATKGYSLGQAFTRLARHSREAKDLVTIVGPVLAELTASTSDTSALNVLKGDVAEVVATVLGPQRLVSHMRLGDAAPLYATSGGKAILAFLPAKMQEEYIKSVKFEAATPATIRSVKVLRAQIREIREAGLALSFDEWTPGITGVARPLLSKSNEVLGSINVTIPSVRFKGPTPKLVADALAHAVEVTLYRLESA